MSKPKCFGRIAEKNDISYCIMCKDRGVCQDRARQPLEMLRTLRESHLDLVEDGVFGFDTAKDRTVGEEVDSILDLFPEN